MKTWLTQLVIDVLIVVPMSTMISVHRYRLIGLITGAVVGRHIPKYFWKLLNFQKTVDNS